LKRASSEKRAFEEKLNKYQLEMVNQKLAYIKENAELKAQLED